MAGPAPRLERRLTWLPSLSFETWPPWAAWISGNPILSVGCSADIFSRCPYQSHGQQTGHQPSLRGLHDVPAETHRDTGHAGHRQSHVCLTMACHVSYMQGYVTQSGALVPVHVFSTWTDHRSLILALTMILTLTSSPSYNPDPYSDLNPNTQPLP